MIDRKLRQLEARTVAKARRRLATWNRAVISAVRNDRPLPFLDLDGLFVGLPKTFKFNLEQRAYEISRELSQRVNDELREFVRSQIEVDRKNKVLNIRRKMTRLGITPSSSSQIDTLLRTELQVSFHTQYYQAAINDDAVWGFRYLTMGDDKVRPAHRDLHGTTLPKDDPFWQTFWPPNGYNCRCQIKILQRKVRRKNPPRNAQPDEGFAFNPGILYATS